MTEYNTGTVPESIDPFTTPWVAAETRDHDYVVVLNLDLDLKNRSEPQRVWTIAKCPSMEFAEYIAYFHNMLLKGSKLLETDVDSVLKGYATQSLPMLKHAGRPEETGGYL